MTSARTLKLQAECMRLSHKQWKSKGEEYSELDNQWNRVAMALSKSRLLDTIRKMEGLK